MQNEGQRAFATVNIFQVDHIVMRLAIGVNICLISLTAGMNMCLISLTAAVSICLTT